MPDKDLVSQPAGEGDFVSLIMRLCWKLGSDHKTTKQAMDFLERKGLIPSCLRVDEFSKLCDEVNPSPIAPEAAKGALFQFNFLMKMFDGEIVTDTQRSEIYLRAFQMRKNGTEETIRTLLKSAAGTGESSFPATEKRFDDDDTWMHDSDMESR